MREEFSKWESFLIESNVSGVSIGIFEKKNWNNNYVGFAGKVQPFNTIPVSPRSVYDIASLTKVIATTTRILQLIQEDKITFDTKVNSILLTYPNLAITIEELLLHCSGLMSDYPNKSSFSSSNLNTFFKEYIIEDKQFFYSDLGFLLLGFIIESIDDSDLSSSFKENIFNPLNMKDTDFKLSRPRENFIPTEITENRGLVVGEVHDSKAFKLNRPAGSAGLFSTLEDLEKFSTAILLNSYPNGRAFLKQNIYDKLISYNFNGRTLGWEKKFGNNTLFHTGFTGTSIGLDIKSQRGLIILSNRVHPNRDNTEFIKNRQTIYERFFAL